MTLPSVVSTLSAMAWATSAASPCRWSADHLAAQFLGLAGQAGRRRGQPAGRAVAAVVADRLQRRLLGQAPVHDVGAARVELAAARQVDQAGRLPGDRLEPADRRRAVRDRLEQALGVGVVRLVEDVVLGRPLRGPARVHHHDVVGDVGDHAQVVGDHDERRVRLALQVQQQVEDLGLDGRVQRRGGLVRDDHLGAQRQRHRDHGALPHAAGELVRVLVDPLPGLGDADPGQQLDGPLAGGGLADRPVVIADHLRDLPADLVQGVQAGQRVLEDDRDLGAPDLADLVVAHRDQVGPVEHRLARDVRRPGSAGAGSGSGRSCRFRTRPRCRASARPRR